nr:hypothetical protein [uncultured Faecalicatena sp.]
MKSSKVFTMFSMLCAVIMLLCPVTAFASEEQNATVVKTEVPSAHTVTLNIAEHASVTVNGKTYTGTQKIEVARLKEQTYEVKVESGWKLGKVSYGLSGQETTVSLTGGAYTAEALYEDGNVLNVAVIKDTSGTTGTGNTSTGDDTTSHTGAKGVKTGDETAVGWFAGLLALSASVLAAVFILRSKHIASKPLW